MPPKKKNAVTGYALFVRDQRKIYQGRGHHFPRNNNDAFNFVGPLWKKLSEEEKKRYNDMAREEKRQGANDLETKFNSLGISYADVEIDNREKEEFRNIMMNTIINCVKNSDINDTFKTQKFYICHVNYFYVNSNKNFKPAEIAFSEFNLKRGVISTFHAFINPGPIETGYRFDAKKRIEETHKIPIEDPTWTYGENDYGNLYNRIKQFLTKDSNGRIPPIYSMPDDEKNNFSISAIKSTIETLCEAVNEEHSKFRIYELHYLYRELRVKAIKESPCRPDPENAELQTLSMALHDLERDKFAFTKGISCEFHEQKDVVNFCSLSVVTRLVYTMCDYLFNYIPEELIEGCHAPKASLRVSEIIPQIDIDDEIVPLRRPQIKSQSLCKEGLSFSDRLKSSSNTPVSNIMAPRPIAPSVLAQSQIQRGFQNSPISSVHLRFQPPVTSAGRDNDEIPDATYEDTFSTPNMSQNSAVSGYTASASLSQSSCASGLSFDSFPILGRGRGILRQPAPPPTNINWALNAGRGSRLRAQQQNK